MVAEGAADGCGAAAAGLLSLVMDMAGEVLEGKGCGGGASGPDRLP